MAVSACSVRVCFVVAGVCPARAVRWVYKTGREPAWLVLSPFFLCGADDGTRTRCLHLGRVTLRLLSFIRSVFPGCSLLVCLRWGVERMTGLEPAASTLARWRSDLLSYIRSARQPRLFRRAGLGAYLSVSFMSVRGVWAFCQPHVVVVSVTCSCWRAL